MAEEEKKLIILENPGNVAYGHKLAALMKKIKEEILHNKDQSTVQSAYVYGIGVLAVLAIDVYVFFAYNTFPKNKKLINEKEYQPPKRRHMLWILYNK